MAFTKITHAGIGSTGTVLLENLEVTGVGTFGGSVSVGGTLTYEDVTNIDSVGIITARAGVLVGSGITLSKDGDVFFTGIATGNGSGLTALNASNISSGTVPTARLGSGTASSSTFLRGDSSFQTVNTDLVSDTSPQLGGDLASNGNDIIFADNDKAIFGTGSDFKIYHNGTDNYIMASNGHIRFDTGSAELARITSDGKLLIGTTTEGEASADDLTIGGSGNQGITIRSGTSNYGLIYFSDATSGSAEYAGAVEYKHSDNFMVFRTDASERLRIDSSGRVLVGHTASLSEGTGFQVVNTSDNTAEFFAYVASSSGSRLTLTKSRSGTKGTNTVVQSGDVLGQIDFRGADGSGYIRGARISAECDGTPGTNDMPGRLVFSTTADGANSQTERLRIDSSGRMGLGTVLQSDAGSAGAGFKIETYLQRNNIYAFPDGYYAASLGEVNNTQTKVWASVDSHYNRTSAVSAGLFLSAFHADAGGSGCGSAIKNLKSNNALTFSTVTTGASVGTVAVETERLRIRSDGRFWLTGADMGGTVSYPSSTSGARIQVGAHVFSGTHAVYADNRLGMQINGDLSASIMLADVYNNGSYPGYGYVMVQGPSTSDYVTYAICPDGPAKGNNMNFHIGEEETNIHSGASVRQVWFNAGGHAYKRDNSTTWSTTSDERLKKNIVDNNKGLAEINQLRVTSFEYRKEEEIDMSQFPLASIPRDVVIEGEEGPHTGVIAQEIESIFPECVKISNKGAKTVDADAITWALVNAIKELSAKNDALEARIAALEG